MKESAINNSKNILIVEDEASISDSLVYVLKAEGFKTAVCATAQEALELLQSKIFALAILDVGLPDMSGFELLRELRKISLMPAIFLTARAEEIDKVLGLEIGADDYVVKPFSPREVLARIKAILRRAQTNEQSNDRLIFNCGPFEIDDPRHQIKYHGKLLDLARYEYRLLTILLKSPGRVYSREHLMSLGWEEPDMTLERTVDSHIKMLRAKLHAIMPSEDPIITHRGVGYALEIKS